MDTIRTGPPVSTHSIYEYDLTQNPPVKKLINSFASERACRNVMELLAGSYRMGKRIDKGIKMAIKDKGKWIVGWGIEEIKAVKK